MPGIHADGANLYLRVTTAGSRQWVFIYRWAGKRREMGLGGFNSVSLARAREKAAEARASVADRIDPLQKRRAVADVPTFGEMADEFVLSRTSSARHDKSVARWKRALGEGGYSASLRPIKIDQVTTEDVLGVLKPIWESKAETAGLVRGYVEAVLSAAKAKGCRTGENPARLRGHLDHLLPARQRLTRGHHEAVPFKDAPAFFVALRARKKVTARALEFLILCGSRTSEVLNATWQEIDLEAEVWTIPAERMKAGRAHRVPLSAEAVALLRELGEGAPDAVVFQGPGGDALSNMALAMLMRRMKRGETVHGWRSSFRDWAGDRTEFAREVAEAALAHSVGDSAERAYRRGDALDKRRELMKAWATYCVTPAAPA